MMISSLYRYVVCPVGCPLQPPFSTAAAPEGAHSPGSAIAWRWFMHLVTGWFLWFMKMVHGLATNIHIRKGVLNQQMMPPDLFVLLHTLPR